MTLEVPVQSPGNGPERNAGIELEKRCGGDVPGWLIASAPAAGAEADEQVLAALRWVITRQRIEPRRRCEAILGAVRFLFRRGQRLEHALEGALVAVSTATRAGLGDLACRAKTACGLLMYAQDNLGGAIESFVDALDIALRTGDRGAQHTCWHNIAAALASARMFSDASVAFKKALALAAEGQGDVARMADTWANVALCAFQQGDLADARRAFERWLSLAPEPASPSDAMARCFASATGVRALLLLGETDEAQRHAARMRGYARLASSTRADLLLRSTEALLRACSGDREAAEAAARDLVAQARLLGAEATIDQLEIGSEIARLGNDVPSGVWYLGELAAVLRNMQLTNALRMQVVVGHLNSCPHVDRSQLSMAGDPAAILESIAMLPAMRLDDTADAMFRVGRLAALIGEQAGLAATASDALERAARLRDVGHAAVPDALLRKPGPLSEAERAIVRTHASAGARIAAVFASPFAEQVARIAEAHHENWDGSGYPSGLAGEAIPLEARIVAVADRFDAMTRRRPYAPPLAVADALAELRRMSGSALDPALVQAAQAVILALLRDHAELAAYLAEPAAAAPLVVATRKIREALADA